MYATGDRNFPGNEKAAALLQRPSVFCCGAACTKSLERHLAGELAVLDFGLHQLRASLTDEILYAFADGDQI
jgi:hypothetical protein